ncbi:MAG: nitrous oxide reductase accessory protein NosL [Nitrospiraceae bacterium]|nr:nitrous oxide reductase accessory protein NosL [Nitrospiraceae bacterium]
MKRLPVLGLVLAVCVVVAGIAVAQLAQSDVAAHKSCKFCGMDRGMFDYSRMLVEYDDGSQMGACSIHCAAIDMATNIDKTPKSIMVGDFNTKQLIDAEKAFWVVGGNKPGVMSKRGKWAFEKKEDAEHFLKTNQGKLATFEEAMKLAYEDMYEDTKMIRDKRKMKKMKSMEHMEHMEHKM